MEKSRVEKRHDEILKLLNSNDNVTISQFCERLGCSESTIRNDLSLLEKQGQLLRTFGGAVKTGITPYNLTDMSLRETVYLNEKRAIAKYVVDKMIDPHITIVLDAGTTCLEIANKIAEYRIPVTVITNSFYAAVALLTVSDVVDLYLFGGMYDVTRGRFFDEYSLQALEHLRADILFLGANGVSADAGITITGFDEAPLKKSLMSISKRTVVVADHSKIGRNSLKLITSLKDVDCLVTDKGVTPAQEEELRRGGMNVYIAS
jgi:DeoR family fructose operon transcriptional repressor